MKVPFESGIRVPNGTAGSERRINVLHEVVKVVMEPLQECELKAIVVKTRELV